MGYKIFVSYKYHDDNVKNLKVNENSTVRQYVDELENIFSSSDNIYKGESDNEDLSQLTDDQIWEKIKPRIFDSSITLVMISPNMKENGISEKEQWIPWEISYSLKEMTRNDRTSHSNAMVAVVLPDSYGSYEYYLKNNSCCLFGCTTHKTDTLFTIIKENKFNYKKGTTRKCSQNSTVWTGESSYIKAVKWDDFIKNYSYYLDEAVKRKENIDDYDIHKELK